MFKVLLGAVVLVALQGCGTLYELDIVAQNPNQTGTHGTYVLAPANADISIDSANFKKYSAQVERVLVHRDLQRLPHDQLADADMIVVLDYFVSDPIVTAYSETQPMFQSRGQGQMDSGTGSEGPSGSGTESDSYEPDTLPDPDFAGKETYRFPRTNYSRELSLRAISFAWDGQDVKSVKSTGNLWTLMVQTVGSSPDLDEVLPVMVAAADPYIATHSDQTIKKKMNGTDKRIKAVSEDL